MFREGQQIGSYTLVRKIGKGGFGEVWLAERRAKFVTTKVAVKLPLDEQIDHEAIKQEATLWEQASGHPNILPIIDADEYDGQIVIVSEYAPDGSLEEWLKANGAMSVERAIETTIQILDGLEFLHSRNIIHRDLKPANILLQGTTPRLADFGISRALRTTVASQSQNISGTFAYMSPEALDGKRSVQTDVWSVGVNLYQFLTGTLPFPHKEPSVLFPAIIMREFAPLPDSIPQSLQNVVAKALAKLPENRYKTAGEMREDLRRILLSKNVSAEASSRKETVVLKQKPTNNPNAPKLVGSVKKQNVSLEDSSEIETVIKPNEIETVVKPNPLTHHTDNQATRPQPDFDEIEDSLVQYNFNDAETVVRPVTNKISKTASQKDRLKMFLITAGFLLVSFLGLGGFYVFNLLNTIPSKTSSYPNSSNSNSIIPMNSATNVMNLTNSSTNTTSSNTMPKESITFLCDGSVVIQNVKLRNSPSIKNSNVIAEVGYGERLKIYSRTKPKSVYDSWFYVRTSDGMEGWVYSYNILSVTCK